MSVGDILSLAFIGIVQKLSRKSIERNCNELMPDPNPSFNITGSPTLIRPNSTLNAHYVVYGVFDESTGVFKPPAPDNCK